jgi:hypothetical protein
MPKSRGVFAADKRGLDVEEVRLISDLRIMHAKVDELYHIVLNLKRRHDSDAIHMFADPRVLGEDIDRVDELYLWFLSLKQERERRTLKRGS